MKYKTLIQLLGFLIFTINHLIYLLVTDRSIFSRIGIATVVLILITGIIVYYDHYFNFKVNSEFKVSTILLIGLNISMWSFSGFYWLAVINLMLLVLLFWFGRRLELRQN